MLVTKSVAKSLIRMPFELPSVFTQAWEPPAPMR